MSKTVLRAPLTSVHSRVTPALYPWLGGKGANLARLERWGYRVPPWYAVTTAAFERCLETQGLDREIESLLGDLDGGDPQAVDRASRAIRARIAELDLPEDLASEIRTAHQAAIPAGEMVAVRSSAVGEDSSGASFAGVHQSVLGVAGVEGVTAALRRVWASSFEVEALTYRLARGLDTVGITMGVVVQQMIHARVSGVAFTCHPATGDPLEIVISSLYGLGPGVVDADLATDRYIVDKKTVAARSELARKRQAFELDGNGAEGRLHAVPVSAELQDRSSLEDDQVRNLVRAGLAIERRMGRPQDIEFALDGDGEILYLQTRPVATSQAYGPAAGRRRVWDLSRSFENYPGISLPMTYSVARRLRRVVYQWIAETTRMSPRDVREWQGLFDSSLGYVEGRLCSNYTNRARFLSQIPGSGFSRRTFFRLLSVRSEELEPDLERFDPGFRRRWLVELPRLVKLAGGLLWQLLWVRGRVDRLLEETAAFYDRCEAMDFSEMRSDELVDLYEQAERELATKWRVTLLGMVPRRIWLAVLARCCRVWCGDRDRSLAGELVRGDGTSKSAESTQELIALAAGARNEPELHSLLVERSPDEVLRSLSRDDRFHAFTAELESYLGRYGHKSFTEMKLEAPTLQERPDLLIGMIQTHLARGKEPEGPVGTRAERQALEAIGGPVLGIPRRLVFRRLVKTVRRLDRQGEEVKAARVRIMDVIRQIVRALGDNLARDSILDDRRDVFYLTLDEVFDYVRGNAVTVDLRGLVALRRRQVEGWKQAPSLKDRFESYGVVYHRNPIHEVAPEVDGEDRELLRGTGCCRGTVTGAVRKLHSVDEPVRVSSEILALESIHTGWIPFLPSVSGLLVERGDMLSHCANVAREFGIPMIVSVPGLMQRLEDGDEVTIDGEKGTIAFVAPGGGLAAEEMAATASGQGADARESPDI